MFLRKNLALSLVLGVAVVSLSACSSMGLGGVKKPRVVVINNNKLPPGPAAAAVVIRAGQLTLEAAVSSAVSYHPSIKQASADARGSNAQIEVAKAGYNPSVQAGVNSSYQKNNADGWKPKLDVSVSQMVFDFGKVTSSVDAKVAQHDADQATYMLQQDRIARDAAEAFIEVQRYTALVAAVDQKIVGVSSISELVSQRTARGASTRSDEMEAQSRVQAAQTNRLEILSQLQQWKSQLSSLTGLANAVPVASSPSWLENSCVGVQPNWTNSPQVIVAEAKKREAEASLRSEQVQALPSFVLEGGASYDVMGQGSFDNNLDYRFGLSVKSSMNNGSAGAAIAAASFATEGADAAVAASKLEVSQALSTALSQVAALKGVLQMLDQRRDVLVETRDLYRQQYTELGTRTLMDLLQSEDEIHQAAYDTINSRNDLLKLGIVCLYSSGNQRAKFAYSAQ